MKFLSNSRLRPNAHPFMKRYRFSSFLGSVLEWYDFALYGFFAPLLGTLFFPSTNSSSEILLSFLVFGLGFVARPLGGILFGHLSDTYGRATVLKITPILIMLPTLAISCLPTYANIGLMASVMLVLLRLLQGVCIGGEYANNMVYLSETAKPGKLFFYSSFGSSAASSGILLASVSATLCYFSFNDSQLYQFGWRLPFLASLVLCAITLILRKNLPESPAFKSHALDCSPLNHSLLHQKRDYLLAFCVSFLPASAFYFIFVFWPAIYSEITGAGSSKSMETNTSSLLIRLFLIPLVGIMADRFGGIKIAKVSSLLFIFLSIPVFILSFSSRSAIALSLLFCMGLLTTLNAGTTPGILANLLPSNTRSTTMSITLNICFGIVGGLTPGISFYAWKMTGNLAIPPLFLVFSGIVTFFALNSLRDRGNNGRSFKAGRVN